ncbi:MAG: MdtA/MuxA family multidrug efflux RND transporter periplasmic adaptor subunit [Burkholderiaceae bacterium]|uniref:MdtA/MuxA family multidrug efflux RND transporter periplasmic adaptor subunit n=1 Tax=Herminiimonas contaminans TaxID=1111140 RepID=A0ABS0EVB6_9BURK|nr:MdtA/MuxA family multidrug efflux RND transporter periplasmic adaptor subunit [Herminiimonas contaminans]MBF8178793.1 MdtA/MuxA family multidrug efflux RND transporter periplasmic adaptor subunit [Herminiimonas contaminans]MBX9800305.1 MdtA/MuxA family multidrug efflux RND transporter periplasmic adaptor subunit [Burkholderiaceae bacterium]
MTDHTDSNTPPAAPRPNRTRPGKTRRTLIWILVILIAAGLGFWWWKSPSSENKAAQGGGGGRFGGPNMVQPVSVAEARRQDIRVTVNAIGSINAANTAIVRVQVSGVLQQINFKEGQQVQAGQLLAQIDPRAFQATLGQAEGVLARDKAQLDNARIDLARYKDLLSKDAIPKQQLDTQEALVRQLEGTVKSDQGTVDSAKLQLSYTRVTAPIAGRVGLKQADLGNVVQPSDTNGVVIITQTRPIALVFSVPSANVPAITTRLRANESMAVEAWDRTGKTKLATGQLSTVDNTIDVTTDTIKVKAMFPNLDDALFPNQAVSVVMQLNTLKDVLAVPQAAVLRGAQGFYVYVVNADSTVSTRVVKPGAIDSGWMAVEAKLEAGEKVVIDGTDRLREGGKVEVIAADPKQRAGASPPPADSKRRNIPPEMAEKLKNMSPEERRAWFQQNGGGKKDKQDKPAAPSN